MLKAYVDDIEALDEGLRQFYRKVEDDKHPLGGKFVLAVEPVAGFGIENVETLKSALASERERREKNDRLLKDFEGLNAADVRQKLERLERVSKIDPDKESDRLAAEKIDAFKTQVQKDIQELKTRHEDREGRLVQQVNYLMSTSEAKGALAKHGGDIELLLPHVERQTRVKETEDGRFIVEVIDDKGIARIKDASGALMTIEDLVIEMRGKDPFGKAFSNSGTSGGGAKPGAAGGGRPTEKNPWSKDNFNLTEQMRISRENPELAARLKSAA
ncbi:hypothetical protein [Chelatococcus asaccharovorans]|uniref:Uncharacterized protein n=1 Tax=Chelatococcus asaccharovorans TaxID=28210 RepID=A0A2V3UAV4_9HYPH|nr:hypothetical protein [Chelatococcus asaccharovorans]MBS7703310.1 hypothetical protein [Chelatococcus asaccharovorans]PXW61643.1 hypothetical protein C7450_103160 [Chelatococcus asaccharovorans]